MTGGRRSRRLGACGLAGLALLAGAYWATREPAPRIRVLWREGISAQQQAALEDLYLLADGRDRLPEGSVAYDLLDTSRSNIRRLVEDPSIADTNDIDRHSHVVEPGTDRGTRETWVAYRVPGLRDIWFRRFVILLFALAALAGLFREWLWLLGQGVKGLRRLVSVFNAHRRAPALSRDVFDAIPVATVEDGSSTSRLGVLVKPALLVLLVAAAGPPIVETWETLALAAGLLALAFGRCRPGWWRLAVAAAVVIAAMGLKSALPRADIAEAHNAFLLPEETGPLKDGLPPEIYASWKAQFDALYTDPTAQWRAIKAGPDSLYAISTDAIWRPAKYTRQVDRIDFRSLAEFRGGFANDVNDNFWLGDMTREEMPFYAMYELSPASVGSRLRWMGQVFWERADGGYDEIRHAEAGERTIEPNDAGKRVYAVFFPKRDSAFEFRLVPSPTLRLAGWADALLTLIGMAAVAIVISPHWPMYLRGSALYFVAYAVLTVTFVDPSSGRLGQRYLPHGGGNDGLPYEAQGREMAMLAGSGRIVEAMMGLEPVYGSTPGTRYVRMVEKLIFGDTNHLFALLLAAVPVVIFYLTRRFVGAVPAWIVTAAFLVCPLQHFAFAQYFMSGRAGYADWIGAGLFLLGVTLLLYHQPGGHRRPAYIWAAGAVLAASMCIRPHIGLAVFWVAGAYAWRTWVRKDVMAGLAVAGGLAVALWVPFHNWYYGGEFNPVTRRENTSLDRVSWRSFFRAPADVLQGERDTVAVAQTETQIRGWLWAPWFSTPSSWPSLRWLELLLRLAALGVAAWVVLTWIARRSRAPADLGIVAGAALWAHAAVLIVFGHHQRYLLAWDLSMVVLIVWMCAPGNGDPAAHAGDRPRPRLHETEERAEHHGRDGGDVAIRYGSRQR